jgi:glyoxylase-like metal-dependent hydrolase (beta-lactamase superfamily II)
VDDQTLARDPAPPPYLGVDEPWFQRRRIDDAITLLWEPHVIELMRCNIWHLRGRDADLIVDTGMGLRSLAAETSDLTDPAARPIIAVATHGHDDHIGSHHEFADVRAHADEADLLRHPPLSSLSPRQAWGDDALAALSASGYEMTEPWFVTALPAAYRLDTYRQLPCAQVSLLAEGDVIDLGDRAFEVLHLPGHSPGSIGLWEAGTGTLFSGDAIYDGPLLDELPDSDIAAYCSTMRRLLELRVDVVHAGHDPSFGRSRLRELATAYLARRS